MKKFLLKSWFILMTIWVAILFVPIFTIIFAFMFVKDWIRYDWEEAVYFNVDTLIDIWPHVTNDYRELWKTIDEIDF